MTAQIRLRDVSGTLRTLQRIRVRDEANQSRLIQRIRVRDIGNVLRTVWQSMTATVSVSTVSGSGALSTITTDSVTVTPVGGSSPYTYVWEAEDYNLDNVTATSPTSATTAFRRTGCISGDVYLGYFRCRVTDASGAIAISPVVNVEITRT